MIYVKHIQTASRSLINRIIPSTCPFCSAQVEGAQMLCSTCWRNLPFLEEPTCITCGQEVLGNCERLCLDCWNMPRAWDRGFATIAYTPQTSQKILQFKNGGGDLLAPTIAQIIYAKHKKLLAEIDIITAMPLHWRRMITRGYNQAGLLAHHLHHLSGKPYNRHALQRVRYTKKQGKSAGFEKRYANIENAIDVPAKQQTDIRDKHVLVIDDVMTSGASLENCAIALRRAGAKQIDVLVFARAGINV